MNGLETWHTLLIFAVGLSALWYRFSTADRRRRDEYAANAVRQNNQERDIDQLKTSVNELKSHDNKHDERYDRIIERLGKIDTNQATIITILRRNGKADK